jgi:glycosyltransferase involved in cell wall biosynthesis
MATETAHLGGAEVMIRNLALDLRSRGHEVGLVAPSNGGDWLHPQMERDGFPVWQFALKGAINPEILKTLGRAIDEFRPDVVHSHMWVLAAYGGLGCKLRGMPHVITMHGDAAEEARFLRRRVALRMAFGWAKAVVVVSDAMQRDLAATLGIPAEGMIVVDNGSSLPAGDRTATRAALGIPPEQFTVLCVGSQGPRKNHVTVLKALTQLTHPIDWTLVVAGPPGESTPILAAEAARLGVTGRLRNLGPRSDVADLLAASDLFVMPSLWEGMPVAMVEAMGAGKPIIGSRVGGIPTMIQEGLEGVILEDPLDDRELAGLIDGLIADPVRRADLGAKAQAKARAKYSVAAMTDTYLDLYQRRPK